MQDKLVDVAEARARLLKAMGEYSEEYPEQIERQFPHILVKIVDLWGSQELVAYLEKLMFTDRDGRQGFPPEVASEMFRLFNLQSSLGFSPKVSGTGWAAVDDVALGRNALNKNT